MEQLLDFFGGAGIKGLFCDLPGCRKPIDRLVYAGLEGRVYCSRSCLKKAEALGFPEPPEPEPEPVEEETPQPLRKKPVPKKPQPLLSKKPLPVSKPALPVETTLSPGKQYPASERVMNALKLAGGSGLMQGSINDKVFHGNKRSKELTRLLQNLMKRGKIRSEKVQPGSKGGREGTRWCIS
jgi:hypothetical protein